MEHLTLALILPRFLIIWQVLLTGSLSLMIIGVVLMHNGSVPTNPFAEYADIYPGKTALAIESYGFTCLVQNYSYAYEQSELHCSVKKETGTFSRIEAIYSSGIIHHLSFEMRDKVFNMGDLAVLLGLSDIQPHGVVTFTWRGQTGMAQFARLSKHFSLLRPVMQITLTDRLAKP